MPRELSRQLWKMPCRTAVFSSMPRVCTAGFCPHRFWPYHQWPKQRCLRELNSATGSDLNWVLLPWILHPGCLVSATDSSACRCWLTSRCIGFSHKNEFQHSGFFLNPKFFDQESYIWLLSSCSSLFLFLPAESWDFSPSQATALAYIDLMFPHVLTIFTGSLGCGSS